MVKAPKIIPERVNGQDDLKENYMYLKSSLIGYTYIRRSKGCSAKCLKAAEEVLL